MFSTRSATSLRQTEYAKLRRRLKGMREQVWSIAVSSDSLSVAAACRRGEVRMWGIMDESGIVLNQPCPDDLGVTCIAFSPSGRFLAAGVDKTVLLWIAKTGQPNFEFSGYQDQVKSLVFSPDSKHIAFGVHDIQIWNVDTKQQLVSASWDATIRIWNLQQGGKLQDTWKDPGGKGVNCCAISPDGHLLASGGGSCQVIIWDVESGEWHSRPYQGHLQSVWTVSFSPDGKHIASASFSKGIHIQDSKSGSYIAKIGGSDHLVAYTPNGKHIVTRDDRDACVLRVMELTTPAVSLHILQTPGLSTTSAVHLSIAQPPKPSVTQTPGITLLSPQTLISSQGPQSISSPDRDAPPLSELDVPGLDAKMPPVLVLELTTQAPGVSLPNSLSSGLLKGPQSISSPAREAHPLSDVDAPMQDSKLSPPSVGVKEKTKGRFAFWR